MNPHDTFFITVRGIIFKDGKLFCQKLKHYKPGQNPSLVNDYWCIPGGHLDHGESLETGLQREMIEETGVIPQIGQLLFTQQYTADDGDYVEFFYHITNTDGYETIDLASTSHGEKEIAEYGFINPDASNILPKFLTCKNIEAAIKNGTVTNYSHL